MIDLAENHPKPKYSFVGKFFHWSFLALFAYGIAKQVEDTNQLEDIFFLKSEIAFALVFLLFLAFRFFYMTKTQKTSLPDNTSRPQKVAAKLVHMSMYISLTGIAFSGLLIGYFFWVGLKGSLTIKFLISIHEFFVSLTYLLVSVHILAAIYHRLKKDNVWSSMVPFWKEE
tara:strand:- start:35 stop:547 length:513 start_codon:yes stop_codon:yes gene_type:complete